MCGSWITAESASSDMTHESLLSEYASKAASDEVATNGMLDLHATHSGLVTL